ncbi:MAG TPA: sulfite exporter TauE/SafE family protein [Nitrososphaerales archaeon]|nr:sulfite exporter TauE/SafE family protein [Nitrososphaerales archaeon]
MTILPLLIPVVVFILGVVTGGFSNVTSGGAGIFTIYFLTNFQGMAIQEATGTVLAASTLIVLIGAISFYRKGQVNSQLAVTVGLSGVVGAFLAARWASSIQSSTLEEAFGGFTLVLACYTSYRFTSEWRRRKRTGALPEIQTTATAPVTASLPSQSGVTTVTASRWAGTDPLALLVQILKGVLIGVATGLFGVGLASLSIVLFMILFKLDLKVILGTSLFASFFRYLGGSLGYLTTGQIDPLFFAILVVGGGIGSVAGARIVLGTGRGSKEIYIKLIVVGMLIFIGYEFLLKHLI